jgi:RNA polymerase sigma-70 factor (ECF subfamily)
LERNEEIQLARDLLEGKQGAFERFVEVYQTKVFQYALMMCGHPEDAAEVAQDTLMSVFQHFDQLREPENARAWVFRIARNACYMKRRKSVFAPEREYSLEELMPRVDHDGGGARIEIADWSALPADQLLREELRRQLNDAITSLPGIYKSVMVLRDVEELSTEETARVLDVSEDVVKTRLHRARMAVRKKLDQYLRGQQGKGNGHG